MLWVTIASGVLTLAILICLGDRSEDARGTVPRALAPVVALPINMLVTVLLPIVLLLQGIPKALGGQGIANTVTRDDLMMTAEMGRDTGGIHRRGYELITNAAQTG